MGKTLNRELYLSSNIHVRELETGGDSRTIAGYAIMFNTPSDPIWQDGDSEARETISPEAISQELLDNSDIKFTMFHDRQLILARSCKGKGTLKYNRDDTGISFEFEAPNTVDGDKALELVKRGDISGCSFAFSTDYYDESFVQRTTTYSNGKTQILYTVRAITGIYDFTLAADPAYPDTSVSARELRESIEKTNEKKTKEESEKLEREKRINEQISDMRDKSRIKIL